MKIQLLAALLPAMIVLGATSIYAQTGNAQVGGTVGSTVGGTVGSAIGPTVGSTIPPVDPSDPRLQAPPAANPWAPRPWTPRPPAQPDAAAWR